LITWTLAYPQEKFDTKGFTMAQKQETTKGEPINEKLVRRIADSLKGIKFGVNAARSKDKRKNGA
jgi:hypothetical protein